MGKSTSSTRSVTGSKNELKDARGSGTASAYKSQPMENRGSMKKRGGRKSKRGY